MRKRLTLLVSCYLIISLIVATPVMAASEKGSKSSSKKTESAVKEPVTHTVTFKYGTKTISAIVEDGGSVEPPTDTFVPGYIFNKWTEESTNVKRDMVILGDYYKTTGTVAPPLQTIPYVESIVTGYTATGKKYNNNLSAGFPVAWQTTVPNLTSGEEGVTCALHWYNGLTGEIWKTDIVAYGTSLAAPIEDPYVDGYEFAGWEGSWINVTEDRAIAAQFVKKFKVDFVDTITGYTFATSEVYFGDTVDLPSAPYHEGYRFCYYSGNNENIHSDIVLRAVYEREPYYYGDYDYYNDYYGYEEPWYMYRH